jgi:predicted amidohydrolase
MMSMTKQRETVTVAAIQNTTDSQNREKVFAKTMDFIDYAGKQGARIVVLPEHWQGGLGQNPAYSYQKFADTIPGRVTDLLCKKAKKISLLYYRLDV